MYFQKLASYMLSRRAILFGKVAVPDYHMVAESLTGGSISIGKESCIQVPEIYSVYYATVGFGTVAAANPMRGLPPEISRLHRKSLSLAPLTCLFHP